MPESRIERIWGKAVIRSRAVNVGRDGGEGVYSPSSSTRATEDRLADELFKAAKNKPHVARGPFTNREWNANSGIED